MSNKRQLEMSASNRVMSAINWRCDLSITLLLLLTSTALIVESAKLESTTEINTDETRTVTKSPKAVIKMTTIATNVNNDDDNAHHSDNNKSHNGDPDDVGEGDALKLRQQNKANTLDVAAENFYHRELQRLSYDTIHSILRDENEPIFRRDDNDRRYYHTKSLQPTHEIMKREASSMEVITNKSPAAITTTPTKRLESNNNNGNIDLSSKSMRSINITAYEHATLLNLSHNELSDIPITANSTIAVLNLNANRIQQAVAPWNNHLKALYLSGNQIEDLTALDLSQLVALEILDLSCNRIKNLELSFFSQLMHNLKYLNLAHNNLETISRETFYHLPSLNTLLLANNNITSIDYETFLSLPSLQYLDLSQNQLKGQSIRALQGIPYLIGLSIAFNSDVGESLQEFVASWSLNEVDASGTGLCQIPAALVQSVRTLKLANNWLKIINCGDLDSYPLLTQLDLSSSRIEDIEDDAMGRLECLEVLFLDHNRLRKVPVSLPTSLEHLFLHNNEIMDLQVPAFQGLKNLKTLDLSHNKLLYLPALPLPKLLTLNLQASGLQGLNQAIVHTLPHLRDLLLEENPIKCSDLLGIAEWASPCRIAERATMQATTTTATAMKTNTTSSKDLGQLKKQRQQEQQQMQTVAKIDLKAKFVQTHNFYEKFAGADSTSGVGGDSLAAGFCDCNDFTRQMAAAAATMRKIAAQTPPACAIEMEDEVLLKVERPTIALTPATVEQSNVNFNEHYKIVEVKKATKAPAVIENTTTTSITLAAASLGIAKNANHAAKMPTKSFATENVVIANVTSAASSNLVLDAVAGAATVMPTKFSPINSKAEKITQISTPIAEPTVATTTTTSTATTSTVATTLHGSITKSSDLILLLTTETLLATKLTTEMPTLSTTAASSSSSSSPSSTPTASSSTTTRTTWKPTKNARLSLLERQRRLDAIAAETLSTSFTTTMRPAAHTQQAKNLARNIGNNDSRKLQLQRKSSNNFENSNVEINKNKTLSELFATTPRSAEATTTITPTTTTTTIGQQHKHVTLQLNVKDRHLIGTPLLTHHGQNLMIAAEELKQNGNHIKAKKTPQQAEQDEDVASAPTATKAPANAATIANFEEQRLDKSQYNQQTEKEVNKLAKVHDAENVAAATTTSTAITIATTKDNNASPAANSKSSQKQLKTEHTKKKPTTLIMKKMTITTTNKQQSTSATSSKTEESKGAQQQKPATHHYNLNAPRENEATFGYLVTSSAAAQPLEREQHYVNGNGNSNKHHSTVNTPVIKGHEIEPQTFQEHNEIIEVEEEAEAAAARASISAKFNSKLHAAHHNNDAEWAAVQHNRLHFDHPVVVFIVGIVLFVTLVLSLMHAYRCKMPEIFNMQRHQQNQQQRRPHRQHNAHQHQNEQQGQQMRARNKLTDHVADSHSFLNDGSNQFQRQWRLERAACNQQQQQQHSQSSINSNSSPFHNLQVRELQQTSAIEACPKYCKTTYNISSALGERSSNSHTATTSSSCSPNSSSCAFDDETCYIEMTTTDVGQTFTTPSAGYNNVANNSISHTGDLLPMELLSIRARHDFDEVNAQHNQTDAAMSSSQIMQPTFQTSAIDEATTAVHREVPSSSAKLTPSTRKLGLW